MRRGSCAGIALGFNRPAVHRRQPHRGRALELPALLRTAVASDDLRACQRIGAEAGFDLGARGGFVERQRWDLERVYGDLVVMCVLADRWAWPPVMRKSEVGPPLDRARG